MIPPTQTFTTTANPAQQAAITHADGPLLIIAGPGSGKTFTLVERIVYLITARGLAPEQLMVVTFTDKAAQELTTRIANRLTQIGVAINLNEMYLGTFHAICLRWLDDYREFTRLKRNFVMMDPFDQQFFLYRRLRDYDEIPGISDLIGPPAANPWGRSDKLLRWLNKVGKEALAPDELMDAPDAQVRLLDQAYDLYQRQLDEENALDFSTIQVEALKLLRTYPQVRDELRARIAHIMVDEYQDTNTIQEQIIRQLAPGDAPNLCVVGDDDQGLYRFRGATIRNILQFADNFPAGVCKQVTLSVNYRSHPAIIDFYNRWIDDPDTPWTVDGQTFRYAKTIVPPGDAILYERILSDGVIGLYRWDVASQTSHLVAQNSCCATWLGESTHIAYMASTEPQIAVIHEYEPYYGYDAIEIMSVNGVDRKFIGYFSFFNAPMWPSGPLVWLAMY